MDSTKSTEESILLILSDGQQIPSFNKRLDDYGYRDIEICSCGGDALDKLRNTRISLVISDVELKGDLDGIETGKMIRDQYDLPLIYLSGLQDETTFQKALATQPLAFLNKPVNWNELRMAIESALFRNREKVSMNAVIKDITAQKLVEDELLESEKKFKNLIESAGDIIYLLDHNLNYLYANNQCLKRYGLTKEELIWKNYRDFHSNESSDEFNEKVRAVQKSGKPSIYEYQSKTDGKYFLRTISPILDPEAKEIESITVISRDITERKKTEEALSESEERFRIASQLATDVVYERDLQTGIATFYGDIDGHLGYEPGEYPRTMEGWREHVHPEDLAWIERQSLDQLEPRVTHGIEYRMRKKDGTYVNWWDRITVKRDEKTGKPVKFIGAATDITELKKTEEELAAATDRLTNNLESMTRLHILGTLLVSEDGMDVVLQEMLDVAIAIANADMGNIQLLDRQSESLKIRAHCGFEQPFLDFWDSVLEGQGTCGTALEQRERVIVEDISQSPIFVGSPALDVQLAAGVRAVLSSPLIGRSGKLIGMCSTHFRTPHRPDEQTLHLLDLHARQVGDIIERAQTEELLRESEQKLKEAQSIGRIGSWEFDVDHGVIEWSDETYRLYERDPALGPPTPEEEAGYYTSEQAAMLHEYARRAIETGEQFGYDLQARLPGGRTAFFSSSMRPIRDESGRVVRLFGTVQDITDRKRIEKALEESETMLRTINENISDIVWRIDADTKITYFSPSIQKILDYQPDEILGQSFLNFIAPEYHVVATDNLSARAVRERKDKPVYPEYEMVARDGSRIPIEVSSSAIRDVNGTLTGFTGVARDIRERKKAETELKTSETRFRAFMENLPVMIYMKDKEGKFIYGNKAILRFAGRTSENYNGARVTELLPGDMGRWMEQMDKKVLKTMKSVDLGEWRWVKDNRERWFREFKFPISLPDGETIIGGWMMEVTLRKTTKLALKESEARYKDLVEKAGIAIMTDDADGNITYFNREFARLFGYTKAEMKKQSWETLIHTGDLKKKISCHKKRMKGEKSPNSYELRGIKKNGNEIWIAFEITVLTEKDRIIGTRNYIRDITNRKKIIEALENSETRYRELVNNMSSGVAVYSYDPAKNDFLFTDINRAGMRISRIKKRKDVINRYLLECFPGARKLGLWSALKRARKSGIPEKLQNTHYTDDRLDQYLENFVYKLKTGELVAVYDDISERVLGEQNILRNYEEIRKLSQHLETVREEERKQIAGELHDELGQILTAIKMDISWIRDKMPPERKGIKKRTGSTIEIIDEAIRSIQRLSMELRPRMLDDLGLLETLKAFFSEYEKWAKISINYVLPQKEPDLIPGQEISVFRIIQESLTNIARHAGATEVKLIIKERNDNLDLKIQDNGIGIPDEKVHSSESFGILNMRERIQGWGGTFEIKGKKGAGTTITASIPTGRVKT